MSAYAAFKDSSLNDSSFHEHPDGDDEGVIQYQQNSSDDESNEPTKLKYTSNLSRQSFTLESSKQFIASPLSLVSNEVTHSRFTPSNDNVKVQDDYLLIGLKVKEFIVINGQCTLKILKGSVTLNNHHYLSDQATVHKILAPASQALPIISCTPLLFESATQSKTESNESELLSDDYSTIIKLSNLRTGLENIGGYYAPFKHFFFSNDDSVNSTDLDRYEKLFRLYSFELLLKDKGAVGLNVDDQCSRAINDLSQALSGYPLPKITMIIGNKNTGKSTFSKLLLNTILLQSKEKKISYLDIDPGQSEYSAPYSLTLSEELQPTFGMKVPAKSDPTNEVISHYFGFTTPIHQPEYYLTLILNLFNHYTQFHKPKGNHLIINTPGWIKGYGKEILKEVTSLINPDFLVLLSNSMSIQNPENSELLNELKFQQPIICPGSYQTSKYSASQLRLFNKLLYFHKKDTLLFDFRTHLLNHSPLKLSYQTNTDNEDFVGINAISILNFEVEKCFSLDDIFLMIESTIMGIYLIHEDTFKEFALYKQHSKVNYPQYLQSEILEHSLNSAHTHSINFMGLCIIHSINREQSYFNVYLPDENKSDILNLLEQGYKMILVKGEGEIPSAEILYENFISEHELLVTRSKGTSANSYKKLPYITFENQKIGGVWKVRRNIMRRSHRR